MSFAEAFTWFGGDRRRGDAGAPELATPVPASTEREQRSATTRDTI